MLRFYGSVPTSPVIASLSFFPLFENTLMDAMRSMDVSISRVTGPLTRTSPFPSHMFSYLYYYELSTHLRLRFLLMLTPFDSSTRL